MEQLSIFDMFDMSFETALPIVKNKKEEIIKNAEDYLQKGEKLLSLAKSRFERVLKDISISSFEQALYKIEISGHTSINNVQEVAKVIRKCMKKAESVDDDIIKEILSLISYDVSLSKVEDRESTPRDRCWWKQRESDEIWCLTFKEKGYLDMYIVGTKSKKHSKACMDRLYKDGSHVADIATVLAYLIVFSIGSKNGKFVNRPVTYNAAAFMGVDTTILKAKNARFTREEYEEVINNPWEHQWVIPLDERPFFDRVYKDFFDSMDVSYEYVTENRKDFVETQREVLDSEATSSLSEVPIIFSNAESHGIKSLMCFRAKDTYDFFGNIPVHLFLNNSRSATYYYWSIPHAWFVGQSPLLESLISGFCDELKLKRNHVITIQNLKELSGEYAKSYQTKKNIPKASIKAMEESIFNEYFGYVEYDEDVDLGKVAVIADEFVAFKETYFKNIDATENAIRFRKLGNHKASGLYYPSVKCLCVDINSPSSLIHEFGHLIDYCYGNLSAMADFLRLSEMYERKLRETMRADEAFKAQMSGKTKYNLDYYLKPTEIFARSFELYCTRTLGVKNSLTPNCFGLPYPSDDEFMGEVNSYFEAVLPSLKKSEDDVVDEKAASGMEV